MTQRATVKFVIIAIVLVVCATAQAFTQQTNIRDRWPNLGMGLRPVGMGSAFLTMPGTDINSQFYNVASTDDFKQDWKFSFMNLSADSTKETYSIFKDAKNMGTDISNSTTTAGKVSAFQTFFNNHVGQYAESNIRLPVFGMQTKHLTFTLIGEGNEVISLRNRSFPNFQFRSVNDAGVMVSTAFEVPFIEGLQVGVGVKGLYRIMIDKIVTTADIIASAKLQDIIGLKQFSKGIGVGVDLGAKYTLPIWDSWAPVLAVSYQDIGNTRFKAFKSNIGGAPQQTPQTVNIGVGVHPELADFKLHLEFATTELNRKESFIIKTHGGAELEFPRVGILKIALRAGANQGYASGGASLGFPGFKLNLAAWGEEVGQYTREQGVYHYGAELAFQF